MVLRLLSLAFLLLFLISCDTETPTIKVACIGDSITYGYGIEDREQHSYPAQLQKILGPLYEVKNFGSSGSTLLKKGDHPIWEDKVYEDAKAFQPDLVVIALGSNDTKSQNWQYKDAFIKDYQALITEFEALPSVLKVWIVRPVPAYSDQSEIREVVIKNELLPKIDSLANLAEVPLIDLHTALSGKAAMFPDGIHPDAMASGIMAGVIGAALAGR